MNPNDEPAAPAIDAEGEPSSRLSHRDWGGVLMAEIARVLSEGGDWCDTIKAQTLAALILGLRPRRICEVGVWMGGSMVPMLLALRTVEELERAARGSISPRKGIAIDAWSAEASCIGQRDADRAWWGAQSHERARQTFLERIERHDLSRICEVVHSRSDVAPVPDSIGLLHLDGNHGEQAVRDVERFCPSVEMGGILVLDDINWDGGHVARARTRALEIGFRGLFTLGTGVVLQRIARS